MRKLLALLIVSLAIPILASDQYIYPPGTNHPIQHWNYPSTSAMTGDTGFLAQDIYKLALNLADGQFYYLVDPTVPTWKTLVAGGGGGGVTTFLQLTDVPSSYAGQAGNYVTVNGSATGLVFTPLTAGNVSNSGSPVLNQVPIWIDATHIKGVTTIAGGTGGQVLTKNTATDYDYGWATAPGGGGGGTVTNIATTFPITGGPINITGTIAVDPATMGNWNSAYSDRMKWDGGATGLVAATGRTSLGLVIGTNVEAWDGDLDAISALTGTNTIYYRSATSTWSPVTIGANMSFSGGVLSSTGAGGGGAPTTSTYVTEVPDGALTNSIALSTLATGLLKNTTTTGVPTIITDNSANWNTAYSTSMQWNGGATGLVAATGRASLALDQVTNNVQTQAAIMPNTLPAAGQIPVGNAGGTAYAPKSITGSGATFSLNSNGLLTISGISNVSLTNSSITIGNATSATPLGAAINLDAITGMAGLGAGIVKRSAANTFTNAAAGTDYQSPLPNVTNDTQTQAAIVPNTAPLAGQVLVGTGSSYLPRAITGSGATFNLTTGGQLQVSAIANASLTNSAITIGGVATPLGGSALGNVTNTAQTQASIVPNTAPAAGQVLVGNAAGTAYNPRTITGSQATVTMSSAGVILIDQLTNAGLANPAMTIAGTSTALGGSITRDTITGVSTNGIIQRTAANTLGVAVAGTDYKVGTTPAVQVRAVGTTTTYTVPAAVNSLYFEAVGGGGGGGGCQTANSGYAGGGGGGGGGGYAAIFILNPASAYSLYIGAGGSAGAAANGVGGNGGNTTIQIGSTIYLNAGGGGGGGGSNGGFNQPNLTGGPGAPGLGTVGDWGSYGSFGENGICYSGIMGVGGVGGGSHFAGRGYINTNYNSVGYAGLVYGGGAGGGSTTGAGSHAGGAGAPGVVVIWEIY